MHANLSLFWRIYFYGLALLFAITAAGIAILHFTDIATPYYQVSEIASSLIADKFEQDKGDPVKLQADLDALYSRVQASLAVYDGNGNTLAKAGPSPAASLTPEEQKKLSYGKFPSKGTLSIPLPGKNLSDTYLLLSLDKDKWHLRFIVILSVAMLVLALLAYPLTRFILRPLLAISETAKSIGSGNLSARTGLRRSDEVGLLAVTIDDMADRLEKLLHSEKEILATISHEFRSPLARMQVALELSNEGADPEMTRSYLLGIEDDIKELDRMVNDVLLAVRLEIGNDQQMVIRKLPLHLTDLVELSAQRFHHLYPDMELLVELDSDLPIIQVDPVLIRRVLDNLLDNSAKYGNSSPVKIHATASSELIVEVRDKGLGVDERDLKLLFTPFFRCDSARSGDGGIGLGLT
ncbi:MAG: HAMP domain-containing sensor histidine kinase, partial [Desulfatitalea sp.]